MPFGFGRGRGRGGQPRGIGRGGRRGLGRFGGGGFGGNCICPNCGFIAPHKPGTPCFQTKCPRCASPMTRQFLNEPR